MFNQFDDILGVRKTNYMTGFSNGLSEAILNADMLAKNDTAGVEILEARMTEGLLRAVVKVTNHAGHRFPSGVGFRRAFLEFTVIDAQYNVVWASGQTNSLGIIVDAGGKPLPSEFFDDVEVNGRTVQAYQPHYQIIRRQDEVQIYEELVRSPEGRFTTSFLAQHDTVKDNRLLPRGWTPQGPQGFAPPADKRHDKQWDFPEATMPKGADVLADTQFLDGTGSDVVTYLVDLPADVVKQIRARRSSNEGTGRVSVRATIYYQAIPPSYLKDRFETAKGENGKRLHHLTSHLNLRGTPIEGWKLLVGTAEAIVQ